MNCKKKRSKRIEELESDKIMPQNQILEIEKQNLQSNKKSKTWNKTEENCASGLMEFQN